MIGYGKAMRIKERLAAGERPKVIAIDENVTMNTVYRIKNNISFTTDTMLQREVERIRRVTMALEENPNAPIRQLVRASRTSFGNVRRIMYEYRNRVE